MRLGPVCEGRCRSPQFPFSDLSQTKRRPALVLVALRGNDIVLCQITSQARADEYSIPLDSAGFELGGLSQSSRIRPDRLFTADAGIVAYRAGHVSGPKLDAVIDGVIALLKQN